MTGFGQPPWGQGHVSTVPAVPGKAAVRSAQAGQGNPDVSAHEPVKLL